MSTTLAVGRSGGGVVLPPSSRAVGSRTAGKHLSGTTDNNEYRRGERGWAITKIENFSRDGTPLVMEHISDLALEQYHLGTLRGAELPNLEEHLLWCCPCLARAEALANYVDSIRAAIIEGDFDL